MEKKTEPHIKVIANNRRARHEYHLVEVFECGLVLRGHEVKSIREGRVNIQDAHGTVRGNEAFLEDMHISPYSHIDMREIDPVRSRKLLLKRKEIDHLLGKTQERGLTLVPLKLYLKGPRVKVELALARGKKLYDKREDIARRDAERDMERALRFRRKA